MKQPRKITTLNMDGIFNKLLQPLATSCCGSSKTAHVRFEDGSGAYDICFNATCENFHKPTDLHPMTHEEYAKESGSAITKEQYETTFNMRGVKSPMTPEEMIGLQEKYTIKPDRRPKGPF